VAGGRNHDVGLSESIGVNLIYNTLMGSHGISRCLTVMLTISTISPSATVDNQILGRADLRLSFSCGICSPIPLDFGHMYARTFGLGLLMLVTVMVAVMVIVAVMVMVIQTYSAS